MTLVPESVIPSPSPVTFCTDSTAPVSISEAVSKRSTVVGAASSVTPAVRAPATVGASLVPVMVMTAVCGTAAPCSSTTS